MRSAARAIIIRDNQMLVMKRHKMGKDYYTLLGGSVERFETPEQAAIRETLEESTVQIGNPRLVFIEDAGDPFGTQHVYLCDYISGEPVLPPDSEEAFWSTPGKNTYEPMWLNVEELSKVPFVSKLLRDAILMALQHGWPNQPYRFSSKHTERLT